MIPSGKPASGRISIGAARLHLWKDAPFFIKADGYRGQIVHAHADVTQDNSPPAYVSIQEGDAPMDPLLLGHNRKPFEWRLAGARKLILGVTELADVDADPAAVAAVKALGHWRELWNAASARHDVVSARRR